MTREEAAEILDGRNIVDCAAYLEALEVAANALCTRTAYMKELDEVVNTLCESVALRAQQAPLSWTGAGGRGATIAINMDLGIYDQISATDAGSRRTRKPGRSWKGGSEVKVNALERFCTRRML